MLHEDVQYVPLSQHDIDEGNGLNFNSSSIELTPVPATGSTIQLCKPSNATTDSFLHWEQVTRGVLFLLSVLFFVLWIASVGAPRCTYVVKYSPANEAVEYVEHVKYQVGLHFKTPWRGNESGDPGPEIDAAWRRISTDVKPIRITEEQLHRMGMEVTPATVRFPEEQGGGYLASLEVTHHLQCLDKLRKAIDRDYYESFDQAFQIGDAALMNQLDTCVEVLRQALMCYPDLNMVTYIWVHGYKSPYPDPTAHRCKNFEKIMDWAAEKAVNVPHRPHV